MCLIVVAVPSFADDLETSLKQAYEGKAFMIRNFYSASRLHYDLTGKLIGYGNPGSWTLDGLVHVENVTLHGNTAQLKCWRLAIAATQDGLDYSDQPSQLEIFVDFGASLPERQAADALFEKIFVLDATVFPSLVPSYWTPCVMAALNGKETKWGPKCRFSSRLSEVIALRPGENSNAVLNPASATHEVTPAADTAQSAITQNSTQQVADKALPVGHGVAPPSPIYTPYPAYSDSAKIAKFQGTSMLGLTVDSSGLPEDIEIQKPLGYGLDEQAVAAVEKWRFNPGTKDGQPVAVRIMVEVSFHLH